MNMVVNISTNVNRIMTVKNMIVMSSRTVTTKGVSMSTVKTKIATKGTKTGANQP